MSAIIENENLQPGMPALLNDNVVLDLTAAQGQQKALSSQKMSNIYGCAIAIDEIDFFVQPSPLTVNVGSPLVQPEWLDYGALLTAKMRVGNINLMSAPVHLRSLGTRWQDQLSLGYQTKLIALTPARIVRYTSTFWRWRLPNPIFMGRSSSLDVVIGADKPADRPFAVPATVATAARVYVAARGRLMPDAAQSEQAYPYATEAAAVLSMNQAGVAKYAMFNNPTFLNPFYNPLRIQRFVASLYTNNPLAGFGVIGNEDQLSLFPEVITAKVWGSRGDNIAGYGGSSPIPLGGFVDPRTGDWQCEKNIDAGQWINLELYANHISGLNDTDKLYPRVAMIGSQMAQFVP